MNINPRVLAIVLAMLCPAVFLLSLGLGRYEISPAEVGMILVARFIEVDLPQSPNQEAVIFNLRLPRVALAMVVGGGLALAGACLQGIFRNPLVSPQILGVASGSGFGGALGLLLGSSGWAYGLAFLFGLLALAAVFFIGTIRQERPVLMLVLAGIVVGGFFQALIALAQYLADPQDALPAITYWLMGSFAGATYRELVISIPILLCVAVLLKMRWWVNVLSMGADYAQTLGVNVEVKRWLIIVCVTVIVAISVSVSGIIGWVGLVIPHI
ncbi:MAG: iron ABC transporter permease, partial [Firmicutes bacterium]|nr:iron ABC transporter permease [Bacillota bacterium]